MPYCYDLDRAITSNGSANTESTHLWGSTIANQETVSILGIFAAARFATAGGAQLNTKFNTGTVASGGTSQVPQKTNLRGDPAAQSAWLNDATAITPGTTLLNRNTVGFAQTGGMGGWIPTIPGNALKLMPNTTNPVDIEFTSNCASTSVTANITINFGEGAA